MAVTALARQCVTAGMVPLQQLRTIRIAVRSVQVALLDTLIEEWSLSANHERRIAASALVSVRDALKGIR